MERLQIRILRKILLPRPLPAPNRFVLRQISADMARISPAFAQETEEAAAGRNHGVAPEASLLVVKLRNDADSVFTDYANLMMAVDYAVRFASDRGLPLSINISYGSNDGPHDGTGLMERYLENCIFYGKNAVVIATGNEGISRRHSSMVIGTAEERDAAFSVAPGETSLYVQLWKYPGDQFRYRLSLPSGNSEINIPGLPGIYRFEMGGNQIRLIISEPTPISLCRKCFWSFFRSCSACHSFRHLASLHFLGTFRQRPG